MRCDLKWLLIMVAGVSSANAVEPSAPEPAFPYTAYVEFEDVFVRSGPGEDFYPTDRLARGLMVDVYKIEGDGWCAVRPPEGSFCWVAELQLRPTEKANVSEVADDNTAAWVGSKIRSVKEHRWQVKLKRGEFVEILDRKEVAPGERWCKIAPPAGDFRWIYRQFLSRKPIEQSAEPTTAPPTIAAENPAAAFVARADSRPLTQIVAQEKAKAAGRGASFTAPKQVGQVARVSAEEPESPAPLEAAPAATLAAPTAIIGSGIAPPVSAIDAYDVELSLIVARPIESWRLDPLYAKVSAMVANGPTVVDRGRARLLLEKVDRFRNLYRQQVNVHRAAPGLINVASAAKLAAPPSMVAQVGAVSPAGSVLGPISDKYDGVGWLTPVVGQRENTPGYVLVDATGRILHYVTPAPGLNLHRYTKMQIGVYGQRGFLPELGASHVTAHRVIVLQGK